MLITNKALLTHPQLIRREPPLSHIVSIENLLIGCWLNKGIDAGVLVENKLRKPKHPTQSKPIQILTLLSVPQQPMIRRQHASSTNFIHILHILALKIVNKVEF